MTIVDSHVHFWDPDVLKYSWLDGAPDLNRAFLPADYQRAAAAAPVEQIVFVEASARPREILAEAEFVTRLAENEPRIAGIVAFADLNNAGARDHALDTLAAFPRVKGIRHNLQREVPGYALQPSFVEGVRAVGRHNLTFDICVIHDQLPEIVELVARAPDTRFVLDHCGKPPIREQGLEPWRTNIARLARFDHVWCKLSGLLTEADLEAWQEEDLVPYANHVVDSFGHERILYGSDWPVVTLAGTYADWYTFTQRFTEGWSVSERQSFYHDNAARFYGL